MDEPNDEKLLIQAAREDSTNDVRKLLKKKLDVNYIDNQRKSALYYAVKNKNCVNVKRLLEMGANIYLQTSTNEILADHAIDILENTKIDSNEKEILELFEQKICEDSVHILKECEELEDIVTRNDKAEKTEDRAIAEVMQKIEELLKRLDDLNFSDYKAANTFLLFLETFSFDDDLTDKYNKKLKEKFLPGDLNAYNSIKKLRNMLLKSSSKIRTPAIIFEVIRFCFVTENENAANAKRKKFCEKLFFDRLRVYLASCKNENPAEIVGNNINTFFKLENEKEIKAIIDRGQSDDPVNKIMYEKFMNLVLKAYKNEIDEDKHWFEFNINIFPCLTITKKDNESRRQLENQILHLRHNFVHSFTQHGSEAFKELIIKLRGKLFEYYYVRKLHARLVSSITRKVNEIVDEINKDFESIRDDFKCDNRLLYLSEEESKNLFASKFEKSLFPRFVANDEVDQSLIEDYFTFIPVIEYTNKNVKSKSTDYDSVFDKSDEGEDSSDTSINGHYLKLDDFSRRRFFEQYVTAKGYLQRNEQENYSREKKRLINDLTGYGVEKECIEKIFEHSLEKGNKLSDSVFLIIEKVGKFINYLASIKTRYNKESKMITVVESFLKDRKDLVILTDHFELSEEIEDNPDIIKLVKTFTSIDIDGIEVDVKATIKMMVKTFYDIFNEYSIEFNVRDLFSRETFLDALINKEEEQLQEYKNVEVNRLRLFVLINQLIQIDYMSPFITKLIKQFENEDDGFIKTLIDESTMKKLIKNLANIECLNSLSILLTVNFDKYNPYQLLHDYIVGKENNLKLIRQIFDKFDHIKGFSNILKADDDVRGGEYIKNIIIPFLEIINENVADQLHYIKKYSNNRLKILLNKKLYDDSLTGVAGPDPTSEYLSEIVERSQENRKTEYEATYEILLESNKIVSKYSNQIAACSVLFINREILKAKFLSCVQEKYENSVDSLDKLIKTLNSCKNCDHRHEHANYILLTRLIKADVQKVHIYKQSLERKREPPTEISPDCESLYIEILQRVGCEDKEEINIENVSKTYEKIKDNDNYKRLLSLSELLCSGKYFDILTVASESAYDIILRITQLDIKKRIQKSDNTEILRALKIYESIYSYRYEQWGFKNVKTCEGLKYIATTYKELSFSTKDANKKLFYCLKALARLNLYYDIRKEIPVGFVRNSVKKNIIFTLNYYIFTYVDISKTLMKSTDSSQLGHVLKKYYELCKKILNQKSSPEKKPSKHYFNILRSIAYICKNRGENYLKLKTFDSIAFYNESLKYFKELSIDAQDGDRKEKYFMQMAKINHKLFEVLTNNFDSKNTTKMNEAAEHLRAAIYFDEKVSRNTCNKLNQLKNHCEKHHLNFDKIWNKNIFIQTN